MDETVRIRLGRASGSPSEEEVVYLTSLLIILKIEFDNFTNNNKSL